MDLYLKDKTAFISGSTSGIGLATARLLLKENANVIINGRSKKSVESAVEELKQDKPTGSVTGMIADFSDLKSVELLLENLPHIDILINNVGIYSSKSFYETSDEDWFKQFEVNVMSGVRLSRALLPKMLDANWGRILFVSSECATLVPADLIAYSTTKTAILAVSRGLAQLTKGSKVTVNTVLPGSTLSDGAEDFLQKMAESQNATRQQVEDSFFEDVRTSSLLQRFAKVEEIASTIVYLSSAHSAATNGSAIKIDGGSMGGIL